MKYRIISPRIGTPGELYEPPVYVNIGVFLREGWIEQIDTGAEAAQNEPTETPKPAKTKQKKDTQE